MTSQHDGVSCDSCTQGGFRGKRYKCLICYDFDLCSVCYEAGIVKQQHKKDHPMQCILSRAEAELYYGGESLPNLEQPQSYTCPYCSKMGFTQTSLEEHVTKTHADNPFEVICPVCATAPGGDPNRITDDLVRHLTLDHRTGPRDLIPLLDEGIAIRIQDVRRAAQPNSRTDAVSYRGRARPRRSHMQFPVPMATRTSLRDPVSVDPIAQLLSHLSGVRRTASNTNSGGASHFQQLQMQWHLDRHGHATRQQLERLSQHQTRSHSHESKEPSAAAVQLASKPSKSAPITPPKFLLGEALNEPLHQGPTEEMRRDRSNFIQELVLSTMLCRKAKLSDESIDALEQPEPQPRVVEDAQKHANMTDLDEAKVEDTKEVEDVSPE